MVVASLAAAPVPASPDGGRAVLWGEVLGPDGARLPGAIVVLARTEGGGTRVAAGALGLYRAAGLAAGTWELTAESPGFAPAREGPVVLAPGESRRHDLRLALAPVSEQLTVLSPAPEDSLEAPSIRESGARDLGQALGTTPGVWPLRRGGIANDVVLRGLQSRDLNVLVDGGRVFGACPNCMDPPPSHVDFAEVERVEVGKGPFDVRHQGGLGGVVDIVTRDPDPGFQLALAVGHAARVPEASERYFSLARLGTDWVGNPTRDPFRTGVRVFDPGRSLYVNASGRF